MLGLLVATNCFDDDAEEFLIVPDIVSDGREWLNAG